MRRASIFTKGVGDGAVRVVAKSDTSVIDGIFLDTAADDLLYLAAMLDGGARSVDDVDAISVRYLSDDLGSVTMSVSVPCALDWDMVAKVMSSLPSDTIAVCAVSVVYGGSHVQ